jgi:hypothetical protein
MIELLSAEPYASQSFSTPKELAKLTAEWPASRLVETWNSFAGVAPFDDLKPAKKFTSRKSAVARIWQAVQSLSADVAQQAATVAPAPDDPTPPTVNQFPSGRRVPPWWARGRSKETALPAFFALSVTKRIMGDTSERDLPLPILANARSNRKALVLSRKDLRPRCELGPQADKQRVRYLNSNFDSVTYTRGLPLWRTSANSVPIEWWKCFYIFEAQTLLSPS